MHEHLMFPFIMLCNKSTTGGCQRLAVGRLIEDKMYKSKKVHNSGGKTNELSPLIVWMALRIVYTYSRFQVNIFRNKEILQNIKIFPSRIRGIILKKKIYIYMHFELSPLIVWIALQIVNIPSSSKYLQ